MKSKKLYSALVLFVLSITAASAFAIDQQDFPTLMKRGDLGTLSQPAAAQRVLKVKSSQRYLNVERDETVKLEDGGGQSFTWRFDTLGERSFPLQVIAPKGFNAGQVLVYVSDPYTYNSD